MIRNRRIVLVAIGSALVAVAAVAAAQNLRVTGRVTGEGPAYLLGQVGIGTTAPQAKLHVDGPVLFGHTDFTPSSMPPRHPDGSDASFIAQTTAPDGSGDTRLYIMDDAGDRFSIWGDSCTGGSCWSAAAALESTRFYADGRTDLGLRGNVGVGGEPGNDKLTVDGAAAVRGDGETELRSVNSAGTINNLIGTNPSWAANRIFIGARPCLVLPWPTIHYVCTGSTDSVSIGSYGGEALHANLTTRSVGIGTNNPQKRLDVAGDIQASGRVYGGLAAVPGRFADLGMLEAHTNAAALVAMKNYRNWWRIVRVPPSNANATCATVCLTSRRSSDSWGWQCLGRVSTFTTVAWSALDGSTTSMEQLIQPDACTTGSIAGGAADRDDWCVCN